MRTLPIFIALALMACLTAQGARSRSESAQEPAIPESEYQRKIVNSLEALKDRSVYAALDRPAVEELARAAAVCWPQEFSGFSYLRIERFSAGGVSHWVTLDPFLIARTECTRKAWTQGAGEAEKLDDPVAGSGQLPISGFSPGEVEIWCRQALLTIPTEAQWEYMCRGGTTTAWAMGENRNDLIRFANLGSLECPESWIKMKGITEPWHDGFGVEAAIVGTFDCNSFGLFDVHGNLNEWCRDDYFDYEVEAEEGTGLRPGNSGERQARGGSYGGDAMSARSARRLTAGAGISPGGNHGFGFRPSLDLSF